MDFRIAFSQRSLTDLREILEHIAEDNTIVAERFAADLVARAKSLRHFPFRHPRDRQRPNVRKMAAGSYLIYYEVLESTRQVNILHFWHGARRSPFA